MPVRVRSARARARETAGRRRGARARSLTVGHELELGLGVLVRFTRAHGVVVGLDEVERAVAVHHVARDALAYTPPSEVAKLEMPLGHGALYKLSAASGDLRLDEVHRGPLEVRMLVDDDVYLCDPGTELIVWMGKGASERERRAAMLTATKYLALQGKPHTTPIKVFKSMDEAMRDESFAQIFAGC